MKKLKEKSDWILLFFSIAFLFCIFAPLNIYLSNIDEFWFSFKQIAFVSLALFVIFFGIGIVLSLIINKDIKALYLAILCLLLFFYIQGNFIPRDYGVLNGEEIVWSNYKIYGLLSIILFVVIVALFVIIYKRFNKKIFVIGKNICLILLSIQLITLTTQIVQSYILNTNKEKNLIVTEKGLFDFSKDEDNILVIILDSFDGDDMKHLLDNDTGEYREILKDFTYYDNCLGMYPTTKAALPYILTGVQYKNEQVYSEYVQSAYEDNPFYKELKNNNYKLSVYTSDRFLSNNTELYSNVNEGAYIINNFVGFINKWYRLIFFDYMPNIAKKYFVVDSSVFDKYKGSNDIEAYDSEILSFYNRILDYNFTCNEHNNCFKIYHTDGVHPPYTFGKSLNANSNAYTSYDEAAGNMIVLKELFSKMKQINVYDNSTIMIMADHGHINYGQNPILLIKNKNEKHAFNISNISVSYSNLSDLFISAIRGFNIDENLIKENQEDQRTFLYYNWDDSWDKNFMPVIYEMRCNGEAKDSESMAKTGNCYIPQDTSANDNSNENSFVEDRSYATHYILNGFSRIGEAGTWTDGTEASLAFYVADVENDLVLNYKASPYHNQKVEVYVNEQKITEYTTSEEEEKSILINKNLIDENNIVKITFKIPNAASPKENGESDDTRKLGLFFKELELSDNISILKDIFMDSIIDFSLDGNSTVKIIYGFSNPEQAGTWTDGTEASLAFYVADVENDLVLNYKASPYHNQKVEVYVNEQKITEYTTSEEEEKSILINKNLIDENNIVKITFKIPNAASPKENGESDDTRKLGLFFKELELISD